MGLPAMSKAWRVKPGQIGWEWRRQPGESFILWALMLPLAGAMWLTTDGVCRLRGHKPVRRRFDNRGPFMCDRCYLMLELESGT